MNARYDDERRIILIRRRTRLDELIARFNTEGQARFYVEHLGADFADYQLEQSNYKRALAASVQTLEHFGRVQVLDREFLPNFLFGGNELVVVLGQDGLVANTLKYLNGQPVVGVNPDPDRFDGPLLPFNVPDLQQIVPEVFANKRSHSEVSMARCQLADGQELLAVNDLFIGPDSHISARYEIALGDRREQHSSSGVIVSTGMGSTGWFRSVLTGSCGIAGGETNRQHELREQGFAWDANYLYYSVREPFPSQVSQTELVFGKVTADASLKLQSNMPEHGIIFSDGIQQDFLQFTAGMTATISLADKRGCVVL